MNNHIKSLDALRGLAAISVMFYHLYQINNAENSIYEHKLFFAAGHEAVILFFVLSGFVLSKSMLCSKLSFSYPRYIVQRLFRIMPLYYFSMIIALVVLFTVIPHNVPNLSNWFNSLMPSIIVVDKKLILQTLFLFPSNKLNGVVWSLSYELVISVFLLPLMVKLYKYKKKIIYFCTAISALYFTYHIPQHFIAANFYYLIFFMMGILLHDNINIIKNKFLLPLFLILYFNKFIFTNVSNDVIRDVLTAFGSLGVINLLMLSYFKSFFENRALVLLGNISYSLYLLHLPIIYYFIFAMSYQSQTIINVCITTSVLLASYLSYNFIEKPFVRYGKVISKNII